MVNVQLLVLNSGLNELKGLLRLGPLLLWCQKSPTGYVKTGLGRNKSPDAEMQPGMS